MHPNQRAAMRQQQRVHHHVDNIDSYAMFNLLTAPQLFERVEAQLPAHRTGGTACFETAPEVISIAH